MLRGVRSLAVAGALALVFVASALGDWGGSDPHQNTPIRTLPSSCKGAPTGKECIDAGVYYLDKARAKVGLPPYALPADFPSMPPPRQIFILANLDRIQYGILPIPGMTAALNRDALVSGVRRADDPHLSHTADVNVWWPGWAGSFRNAPMAYEAWVWDDARSTNPRCVPSDRSRCWGHRHSVLWKYGANAAMGAAAGRGSRTHSRGYAYLFVGGDESYTPAYTYTWKQAVEDGAGTNSYDPGPSPGSMCHVPIAIGMGLPNATRAIKKGHCTVGDVVKVYNQYVAGTVIQQRPGPQKTVAAGTAVKLTVSLGPRG